MEKVAFKFSLGIKARDKTTLCEGIITSRSQDISGCNTYLLTPKVKPDGEEARTIRVHEMEIEVIDNKPIYDKIPSGPSAG